MPRRLLGSVIMTLVVGSQTTLTAASPPQDLRARQPAQRLSIIDGSPQSLSVIEDAHDAFVALDELFAALRWKPCAAARCVVVPTIPVVADRKAAPAVGTERRWRLTRGTVESIGGTDFASVRQLDWMFGLRAGWDHVDKYLWILTGAALPAPSRVGPDIPIPSKNYGPFDGAGIPMKDQGAAGVQYNPLVVLEYSTIYFRNYLDSGDRKYRAAFFRMIDWLDRSAVAVANAPQTAAWYYDFDWPPFAKRPFLAGITQSYAGSAFIDAYILSGDAAYLAKARRAIAVLKLPISKGGVYSTDRHGRHVFLEEYPSAQPSRVLGGCVETVLRLQRYLQYDNDAQLKSISDDVVATIRSILPLYDAPEARTSRYALSQEVRFRLVTDELPVRERHPVFAIKVLPPDDQPYELLVGDLASPSNPGYRIVEAPAKDWSSPIAEGGRQARAFQPMGAADSDAAFYLRLSGFLLSAREQFVEIDYRDVSREDVHLDVYSEAKQGYIRLGTLENKNDGQWKTLSVAVTPEMLGQTGFGLLAPGAYTTMHIGWLMQLAAATGEPRFSEYANKWQSYLTIQP